MDLPPLLKNRWITRLLWAFGALLLLWVLAWLAIPSLLKSQIQTRGSEALGRTLTVGTVEFKPWTLELTLSDIQVAAADGKGTQLSIAKLYADAEMQSLWRLAPVVDAITIDQPHLNVTHLGDGHYDFDDVLQRFQSPPDTPPKPASAPPRFALYNLVLNQGSVDFTDHRNGAEHVHTLRKLDVSLPFLSSFDSQRDVTVQPHLGFELNGSSFDSAAQATPFAPDAKGDGSLKISHLDMAPYLPYLPASLPVRLKSAVLDGSIKLAFGQKPERKLVLSGDIEVSNLQVDDPAGASLLAAQSIKAVVTELRPLEQKLDLASLTVSAPKLALSRDRNGKLNLVAGGSNAKAKPEPKAEAKPVAAEAPAQPWQLALAHVSLKDGQVRWSDAMAAPAAPTVQLALDNTQLDVRDVHWPFVGPAAKPAAFEASTQLQAPQLPGAKNAKPAHIALQGSGTDAQGLAKVTLSDLDLSLAAPYLTPYLLPRAGGLLEGELSVGWKAQGSDLQLQAKRLALHDFALTAPAGNSEMAAKDMPSIKLLELSDLAVDLNRHAVTVGKLSLQKPAVRLARGEDGQWMYSRWLPKQTAVAPASAATPTATTPTATMTTATTPTAKAAKVVASAATAPKAPAWTLALAEAAIDQGSLVYVDRVPTKPVFLEFSALQAQVKNASLDGKKPAPLKLSAKVRTARAEPGSLRFDGSLSWDPLVAQGQLEAVQFPAQALAPYGMTRLRASLLRADTSFKGQLRYAALAAGPEVQLRGDAAVEELRLNSDEKTASGAALSEELLSWKALSLPGLEFNMAPNRPMNLKLREVSLSDFFARLIVNSEGRLVLQDLVVSDTPAAAATDTASTPAAPASAPVAAAAPSANDPVIEVGMVRLVNGHVAFSDRFIKPNYSADLTELSGSLSRFSSQKPQTGVQMADLELRGRAEGTASLDIAGKVNPLAKPLALDVTAKVRDLELSPLSSYAIKYAGYGIERGRLSVDVHYTVSPDGKLEASNQLTLNQLVFGDAVPGATTSLPVKLAVTLLADRNGVIDLNVPLSGSLNDPQFRVWPIVWKVIGNLITKALVSPFSLISGLVGGGDQADELSTVAFDPGTARISAAALPGLDKVANALREKEALSLTVVGTASLEREREAMQRERLNALLLAEKRRQAASDGKDVTAVTAFTPEEYPGLLVAAYKRSGVKKPRNLVGLAKDLPADQMEALLLQSLPVNEDAVRELALSRSLAVREYLTSHQVPSARLFLGAVNTAPSAPDWQARVELNLEQH